MKTRKKRKKQSRSKSKEVVSPVVNQQHLSQFNQQLHGQPCILCGQPATHMSVFVIPDDKAKLMGVPPGKLRQCAYPICRVCIHKQDTPQRVEDIILNNEMSGVPRV